MKLTHGLRDTTGYTDNYNTCVHLSDLPFERSNYLAGTLRPSRKLNPNNFVQAKLMMKDDKGKHMGAVVLKCKDKLGVLVLNVALGEGSKKLTYGKAKLRNLKQ
jgi:hypothetical protein